MTPLWACALPSFLQQRLSWGTISFLNLAGASRELRTLYYSRPTVPAVNFIFLRRILRKARLDADEDRAATKRRSEETLYMLKDPARKNMNAERLKAGALRRRGYLSTH